jgi:hypothetical protein
VAVAAPVPDLCQLLGLGAPSPAVAFLAIVGVLVDILVALFCREFCDSLGEGLDLRRHHVDLGVLAWVLAAW